MGYFENLEGKIWELIIYEEASELELKKFISNELSKLEENGIKVVDFQIDSSLTKFVIAIEQSAIYFVVTDDKEFKILSAVHNGKKYINADYLCQFNDFVTDVITVIMPIVKEKKAEYMKNPDMIEYREEQAKLKEEHLEKRTLELQAREQLLAFQMQAIDMENQMLEDEKVKNDEQKVRKWARKNSILLKWIIAVIIIGLALMLVLLITQR